MPKAKAKDLVFISQIKKDGSGVIAVDNDTVQKEHDKPYHSNIEYRLSGLSMTLGTYIASHNKVYVVKLKEA